MSAIASKNANKSACVMEQSLTITFCQPTVAMGRDGVRAENREHVEALLSSHFAKNALAGSDVIVLPEVFTTGFDREMASLAEPSCGETLLWAQALAGRYDSLVVASWVVEDSGSLRNRMHFVSGRGLEGHYDKAHLFAYSGEDKCLTPGSEQLTLQWRGWRVRAAVCYDLRFPVWLRNSKTTSQQASAADYDLLLVCANWPHARVEAWQALLRARAIENQAFVLGVNRVGTDVHGVHYSGLSTLFNAEGAAVATCGADKEAVVSTTLSHAQLLAHRTRFPFLADADPFELTDPTIHAR